MIIIFLSVVSFVLALTHFVIYKVIISLFSFSSVERIIIGIILTILCLSFIIASILTFNFNNSFTRIFYITSASWLGFAFYLFLFSCIYILTLEMLRLFGVNISLKWFGILCLIIAIIIGIYGLIHARYINIKNINVALPNLPVSWQGKKAVWISDLHLGVIYDTNFTQNIVNKINEINPDIVFIGGDLYDGTKVDEIDIVKPFTGLHPALGTYFITGNHEEFRNNKVYLNAISSTGIHILDNEMIIIDGVQIIGVNDKDSTNVAEFNIILSSLNIDKSKPIILLKHQPFQLAQAAQAGISFQISGHTHQAQMFPLNIFTNLIYKGYDYGFHKVDKMDVFTSNGVGTWGPPMRVGNNAEIVVFNF
ncbi:MAG: metallophosphoesterase [Candidatus Paceibacterota bacterium]